MFHIDDIQSGNLKLTSLLSHRVTKSLPLNQFTMMFLNDDNGIEIEDADQLIEAIFPKKEAEEYKPSNLLLNEQTFCIAILKSGIVIACLVASLTDDEANLHTLAVDTDYRSKKLGSILLILMNEVCTKLNITSASLISSGSGEMLYESFKFDKLGHNAYQSTLPFNSAVLNNKLDDIKNLYFPPEKKRRSPYPPALETPAKKPRTDKEKKDAVKENKPRKQ